MDPAVRRFGQARHDKFLFVKFKSTLRVQSYKTDMATLSAVHQYLFRTAVRASGDLKTTPPLQDSRLRGNDVEGVGMESATPDTTSSDRQSSLTSAGYSGARNAKISCGSLTPFNQCFPSETN